MPSLDEGDTYDAGRFAAMLGVHLVTQVLDEACSIANAAQRIGWPWTCVLSIYKDAQNGMQTMPWREELFEAIQSGNDTTIETEGQDLNVATSTPQKGDLTKLKAESNLEIGQGDEEFDMHQNEMNSSTSMYINNLFDMTEVEKEVTREEITIAPGDSQTDTNSQMVVKITETLFNTALDVAINRVEIIEVVEIQEEEKENSNSLEESCYSFIADAKEGDVGKNIAFYIDDDAPSNDENDEKSTDTPILIEPIEEDVIKQKCDVARFEDAYLTLNRDYEQCSDDDGEPVLQDPKALIMQDVELMTASTSDDNLSTNRESEQARKELAATSAVSGASGSRKSRSSLMSRCRSQGARMLSCLRGWWRRKTPGKRKESRKAGLPRGVCPLSPDARRRAASLLDHRDLCSPPACRSVGWKFNTVNEALVNSTRWKEYTFEGKPEECGVLEN